MRCVRRNNLLEVTKHSFPPGAGTERTDDEAEATICKYAWNQNSSPNIDSENDGNQKKNSQYFPNYIEIFKR